VDWWAWGEEAFAEARRRDVPIFLSIGYSTCYWCHVMERESFEDEAIARQMNDGFVCIKVDREERPDVDDVYMAATVITTGHGGWPMSVFLEPKTLRPFLCGTYFPAKAMAGFDRGAGGRPTFPQLMQMVSEAWRERREAVEEQARQIGEAVREQLGASAGPVELSQGHVANAVSMLLRMFDRVHGGFGSAPKFPQPVFLEFLLDVRERVEEDATRAAIDEAVRKTLDAMMIGGIRDHVGGGFHRYAVDATWTVPHFEKMLYDNAQLASVYARAARVYGDAEYARVVHETLTNALVEFTVEGAWGFASAQDAEVDGREGMNYVWTADEVRAALRAKRPAIAAPQFGTEDDAEFAIRVYGLDEEPNFRDPHHPDSPSSHVLRLRARLDVLAEEWGFTPAVAAERLARVNRSLLSARYGRKQPRRDDKIIASWNGLMMAGGVAGYELLGEGHFAEMARSAANSLLARMRRSDGLLLRSVRGEMAGPAGVFEDYSFVIHGLLAVHRLEPGVAKYLAAAVELLGVATREFGDGAGGFYDTAAGRTDLFVRGRSTHDGAVPSGASVMLHNLIDLGEITGEPQYFERAVALLASISPAIARSPVGAINATRGLLRLLVRGEERPGTISKNMARGDSDESGSATESPEFLPVEVYASVDRVTVGKELPAELKVLVRIAEGHHVIAADPGEGDVAASLTPFRVGVVGGTGIAVYADYPEGEEYGVAQVGMVRVYRGEFEMSIVLEAEGEWKGTPLVSVTYQACTESECLRARVVELDVAVDRG
jgi:hypothetical protein